MMAEHRRDRSNASSDNTFVTSNNGNIIRPSRANRTARHYKSSSVLNCSGNGIPGCSSASSVPLSIASTQALPRLANALRSLISSAGHSAASAKSKSAFVDAGDELIYYSNVIPTAKSNYKMEDGGKQKQRSPSLTRNPSMEDDNSNNYFLHRQPTTLDQIRALYKSVPNFANLEDDRQETEGEGGDRQRDGKVEGPIGRLCLPLPHPISPFPSAPQPPPLQPQRKRLFISGQHPQHRSNDRQIDHPTDRFSSSDGACSSSTGSSLSVHPRCQKNNPEAPEVDPAQSPPGSLGSCSLSSASALGTGSSGSSALSAKLAEKINKKDPLRTATGKKKMSPTDSGYRSRGETPREKGASDADILLVDLALGHPHRPHPSSSDNLPPPPRPLPPHQSSASSSPPPSASLPRLPRNFVWTQQTLISLDQLRSTSPINVDTVLEAICNKKMDNWSEEEDDEGRWRTAAEQVAKELVELIVEIGAELRRLSAVLGKCTCRDVAIAILLFLPPPLAWHTLRHAHRAIGHFGRSSNDPSKRWRPMSARGGLEHLQAGMVLRWMNDCRIGAMVDERVCLFLASVLDSLLSRLRLSDLSCPSADLLSSLAQSLPLSRSFHLLCPPSTSSLSQLSDLVRNLPLRQMICAGDDEEATIEELIGGGSGGGEAMTMDAEAVMALHHFVNCSKMRGTAREAPVEQWLRRATLYAIHRRSLTVRHWDVLQAAHSLHPDFDCPPPNASEFFADDLCWRQQFCPSAKALLLGSDELGPTAKVPTLPIDPKEFPEFKGWTPLCWALALGEIELVERMLREQSSVGRAVRTEEKHIQICASTGHLSLCELLIRNGANPFKSGGSSSAHFGLHPPPSSASPSAFAIAISRGDRPMLSLFLHQCCSVLRPHHQNVKNYDDRESYDPSRAMISSFRMDPLLFASLSEAEKRAFAEGIYLATETQRWELAMELRAMGAGWPGVGGWMGAVEWMMAEEERGKEGRREEGKLEQLLEEFGPKMAEELIATREEEEHETDQQRSGRAGRGRVERLADTLFRLLVSVRHARPVHLGAARALSVLFTHLQKGSLSHLERELNAYFPSASCAAIPSPPQIDPKFVDCPDLSDIRFRFGDGQIVFAHRIVLVNASDQFRRILRSPSGIVNVSACSASIFRLLLEFVYGNSAKCVAELARMDLDGRLELFHAAKQFGMHKLEENAQKAVGAAIDCGNLARIYTFATDSDSEAIREDCERFALSNLGELVKDEEGWGGGLGTEGKEKLLEGMKKQMGMAMRESRI